MQGSQTSETRFRRAVGLLVPMMVLWGAAALAGCADDASCEDLHNCPLSPSDGGDARDVSTQPSDDARGETTANDASIEVLADQRVEGEAAGEVMDAGFESDLQPREAARDVIPDAAGGDGFDGRQFDVASIPGLVMWLDGAKGASP